MTIGAQGGSDDRPATVEIVDELGHPVLTSTRYVAEQMLAWLDLEASHGDLTPGLAEVRDLLRAECEKGVYG